MDLPNPFHDKPNLLSLKYKKPIDNDLVEKLIFWIQSACKKSTKAVVEINSSVNSLLAGVLFQKALGEKVTAIIFDFDPAKTGALINTCKQFNLTAYSINRAKAYGNELMAYRLHKEEDIRNFYMRFTNYHLLTTAEHLGTELADTEDKSERLTTLRPQAFYGSIMPFYSFYKTEIFDLAKLLNIPSEDSSTDYWTKVDPILFLLTEKQLSPEEISQQYHIDLHWLKKLKSHIEKQNLKTAVSQFII